MQSNRKFNVIAIGSSTRDVLLKSGSVPLTVMRELVMKYIADKQAA